MTILVDQNTQKSQKKGWVKRPVLFFALMANLLFVVLTPFSCDSPQPQVKLQELHGRAMGTTFTIKWHTPTGATAPGKAEFPNSEKMAQTITATLEKINQIASTYSTESEISHFNARRHTSPIKISEELGQMVEMALAVSQRTSGQYDITASALVNLWGFGPAQRKETPPAPQEIEKILQDVGWHRLTLKKSAQGYTLAKARGGVTIDLSSIAKGYAIDRLAQEFERQGITYYMIELGGEVRAGGGGLARMPLWRIGVQTPSKKPVELLLGNESVATSGNYLNFFRHKGKIYSHIINPKSGYPVESEIVLASVIHSDCARADAWATAFMTSGVEQAQKVALDESIALFIVSREGDSFRSWYSPRYQKYMAAGR